MQQYFQLKSRAEKRHKLTNILDGTAAATGVSRATISRVKTHDDVHNWTVESRGGVQVIQNSKAQKSTAISCEK